jgi:hypothetical protein
LDVSLYELVNLTIQLSSKLGLSIGVQI